MKKNRFTPTKNIFSFMVTTKKHLKGKGNFTIEEKQVYSIGDYCSKNYEFWKKASKNIIAAEVHKDWNNTGMFKYYMGMSIVDITPVAEMFK